MLFGKFTEYIKVGVTNVGKFFNVFCVCCIA
jgi:hypothetical protein